MDIGRSMSDEMLNSVKSRLYLYGGAPYVSGNTFVRQGDVFWREDLPDGQVRFTSSRGAVIGGQYEKMADDVAQGRLLPAVDQVTKGSSDMLVQKGAVGYLRGLANSQACGRDADGYAVSEDGTARAAMFRLGTGCCVIEREGGRATLVNGVPASYTRMGAGDYQTFNPEDKPFGVDSDWDRHRRLQEEAAQKSSPLLRVAAMVTGRVRSAQAPPEPAVTAYDKISGFMQGGDLTVLRPVEHGNLGLPPVEQEPAYIDDNIDTDKRSSYVPSVRSGMVLTWTERRNGHSMGMATALERQAVVLSNTEQDGLRLVPIMEQGSVPAGHASLYVPEEGPFLGKPGYAAVPGAAFNAGPGQVWEAGMRIRPGGPAGQELVDKLRSMDGAQRSGPMDALRDRLSKEDGSAPVHEGQSHEEASV